MMPPPAAPDVRTPRATIYTNRGWWFHYAVHRRLGVGIPEASVSLHHSLKRARRAVRRWEAREPDGERIL
jgi:hypothetical protein